MGGKKNPTKKSNGSKSPVNTTMFIEHDKYAINFWLTKSDPNMNNLENWEQLKRELKTKGVFIKDVIHLKDRWIKKLDPQLDIIYEGNDLVDKKELGWNENLNSFNTFKIMGERVRVVQRWLQRQAGNCEDNQRKSVPTTSTNQVLVSATSPVIPVNPNDIQPTDLTKVQTSGETEKLQLSAVNPSICTQSLHATAAAATTIAIPEDATMQINNSVSMARSSIIYEVVGVGNNNEAGPTQVSSVAHQSTSANTTTMNPAAKIHGVRSNNKQKETLKVAPIFMVHHSPKSQVSSSPIVTPEPGPSPNERRSHFFATATTTGFSKPVITDSEVSVVTLDDNSNCNGDDSLYCIMMESQIPQTFQSNELGAGSVDVPGFVMPVQIFGQQNFCLLEPKTDFVGLATCHVLEYLIKLHGGAVVRLEDIDCNTWIITSHQEKTNKFFRSARKYNVYNQSLIYELARESVRLTRETAAEHLYSIGSLSRKLGASHDKLAATCADENKSDKRSKQTQKTEEILNESLMSDVVQDNKSKDFGETKSPDGNASLNLSQMLKYQVSGIDDSANFGDMSGCDVQTSTPNQPTTQEALGVNNLIIRKRSFKVVESKDCSSSENEKTPRQVFQSKTSKQSLVETPTTSKPDGSRKKENIDLEVRKVLDLLLDKVSKVSASRDESDQAEELKDSGPKNVTENVMNANATELIPSESSNNQPGCSKGAKGNSKKGLDSKQSKKINQNLQDNKARVRKLTALCFQLSLQESSIRGVTRSAALEFNKQKGKNEDESKPGAIRKMIQRWGCPVERYNSVREEFNLTEEMRDKFLALKKVGNNEAE